MKASLQPRQARTLRRTATVLTVLGIVATLLMTAALGYVVYYESFARESMSRAEAIGVQSQHIAQSTAKAVEGSAEAFGRLQEARGQIEASIAALTSEDSAGEGEASSRAQKALQDVVQRWRQMRGEVDSVLERRDSVLAAASSVKETAQRFGSSAPRLEELARKLVERLTQINSQRRQIYSASQLTLSAEHMGRAVSEMRQGGISSAQTFPQLEGATEKFGELLQGLREGSRELAISAVDDATARGYLNELANLYTEMTEGLNLSQRARNAAARDAALAEVSQAADAIAVGSDELLERANTLAGIYRNLEDARPVKSWHGAVFGMLALILLASRSVISWRLTQAELREAEAARARADEQSKKSQEAIVVLLDEIQGLRDGDLTVQASVGEAFTGAIGDAFNDAIEELRSLVSAINEISGQVSSAAQHTQATAMRLAEASDHQAHQITGASTAVNDMAVSIEQVSRNAEESSRVAQQAVDIALKGAATVKRTIAQMDSIREQIQETSKRIKRLGESSQEIGNIVELINDIADQTNILALNASIQAAMAGESGRGFAVVADEVQRLAERSGNATKQIENLVKTIQTDTNEAAISMEESTTGVVAGARQAEEAGVALHEIESVSQHLAGLIRSISEASRQQANVAGNISDSMNVIQEITSQTSAGTNETATSIGNLADLAADLRGSVAGFKLPEPREAQG